MWCDLMQNLLKEIPQNLFDQIQNDVSLNFFMEKVRETVSNFNIICYQII